MADSDDSSQDQSGNQESSDSSSEDEEIADVDDRDFFKTLSCLKNKDPRIYDQNVNFFTKSVESVPKRVKPKKSIYVKDYVLDVVDEGTDNINIREEPPTYVEEQQAYKQFFKDELKYNSSSEDEGSEDLMKIKIKSENDKEEEEVDYIQFLKGNKCELENKAEEKELRPLHDYWNRKDLDENEEFLKEYILNKAYLINEANNIPTNEDLSEDEKELDEQAEFENNYNRMFETEENLQVRRFPRKVEGSLRRKDDSRKRKRSEISQRKKEEKTKKQIEIKRKQKEKLIEIEERLQKLKKLSNNDQLCFKEDEMLEDFDPEKYDKKMNEFFNEDYYNQEDDERPIFDENDYENWEYEDVNMNCEMPNAVEKTKKLTRSKKKKLMKKKAYTDIMDIVKPSFNPEVHNNFKEYFDEYYNLDCEDFIDDLPCRFKYREVVPNNYGLSIEEILMADDSELNKWSSIKKICKRRPEHVEKNEVKIYSMKAKDEDLKRKILCSLYSDEKDESVDISLDRNVADIHNQLSEKGEKNVKEKSLKKKGRENVIQSSTTGLNKNDAAPTKSKKRKHNYEYETPMNQNCENNIEYDKEDPAESLDCIKHKSKKKKTEKFVDSVEDTKNPAKGNIGNEINSRYDGSSSLDIKKKNIKKVAFSHKKNPKPITKSRHSKKHERNKSSKTVNKVNVVDLSDNRLRAYGIQPKKFRAKIKYSKKQFES